MESPHTDLASAKPSTAPESQVIEGLKVSAMFSADCFRSAFKYKPRPDDVFIVTYPKCGTTWAQHILVLIFRQGQPMVNPMEFFAAAPYLEMAGVEYVENMPRPGAIKTHLPYRLAPRSEEAKYIYITRNPKDCCVSYFHHMKLPAHGFTGTFDEYFEIFISGNADYGDYLDHLLGWYAHRNDPNVLFMTYEEMKEQPEESVLKMASFIDDELYAQPLRDDPEKLQNIIKYSSFNCMKENMSKSMNQMFTMKREDILSAKMPITMKNFLLATVDKVAQPSFQKESYSEFIRKGIVGDWKNYFSEEQDKRLKEKFAERTKGTDIPKLWEKYM